MNTQHIKTISLLAAGIALAGCDEDKINKYLPKGEIRVIHASADAPPVNVLLNGDAVIENLDYAESSGFSQFRTGNYHIEVEGIIPGGNATVISVPDFRLSKGDSPTIIALNDVATIAPIVVQESAAQPESSEVALVVTHAASVAGAVDVYVTAPGADISAATPAFNFDFQDSIDVGALGTGTVELQVGIGSTLVYNSGPIDLTAFNGEKIMIVAVNSENQVENTASPIKLLAVTDSATIELKDADTAAGAKVVHASPDANTAAGGPVEVFATSPALGVDAVELIDAFDYTDIVPTADTYVEVPASTYQFDVAPDTDTIGDSVYTSPELSLGAGMEYTVIAAGRVLSTPGFGLLATGDENRAIATQGSIKLTHAAPAAGDVDVFVTAAGAFSTMEVESGMAGAPLLENFSLGTITDYVGVAPGSYDIRVVAGGTTAINIEGFTIAGGDVFHAIARGPSEPSGSFADFGVIVLSN